MKKTIFTIFCAFIFTNYYGQDYKWLKNAPDGSVINAVPSITPLAIAKDFSITFTDGTTTSLYATLAQGKTVLLDFFFTTCPYCIQYAPIIDQSYVAHGSGKNNVLYWGIDHGDNNAAVKSYMSSHSVSNPCASGVDGKANAVCSLYGVQGYPTYAVICSDKTLSFDVNYPPSATGFDSFISACPSTTGIHESSNSMGKITDIYPNPSSNIARIKFNLKESSSVSFELYNMVGEKVFNYEEAGIGSGNNSLNLPVSSIADGMYIIKMMQNNQVTDVQKLLIKK